MMKQAVGFAVFGAVVATFGAAVGRSLTESGGYVWYSTGISFAAGPYTGTAPWLWLGTAAAAGAVISALIGVILHVVGVRIETAGRRIGRVVAAGLFGIAAGLSPTLIEIGSVLAGLRRNESVAVSVEGLLLLYAGSAVLGYVGALAAVYGVLRATSDPWTRSTVTSVAAILPVGVFCATVAGMGVGWAAGYTTTVATFAAVMIAVAVVLAATLAVARARVLRTAAASE